jgi:hypothetical protein
MHDFIEVYPDAISRDACRDIVNRFEASTHVERGKTAGGVDATLKDSYDLTINRWPEWRDVNALLQKAAFAHLKQYIRKYPFLLMGPLALRYEDPATGSVTLLNEESFPHMTEEVFTRMVMVAFRPGPINLQKYLAGQGGYPHWHSECCPRDASCETLHRVLLFTFYLNDVPEAGETEFFYQGRKIAPRAGSLIFAPAGFTHTHRGNTPVGSDKYIATSWILFSRAETLYALPVHPDQAGRAG